MKKLMFLIASVCCISFANASLVIINNSSVNVNVQIWAHDNTITDCEYFQSQTIVVGPYGLSVSNTKGLGPCYTAASGYTTTATPSISQGWDLVTFQGSYSTFCAFAGGLSNGCAGSDLNYSYQPCNDIPHTFTATWAQSGSNVTITFAD